MSYVAAFKWKRDHHCHGDGPRLSKHAQILRLSSYLRVKQRGFLSGEDILQSLKDEIDHYENITSNIYASAAG